MLKYTDLVLEYYTAVLQLFYYFTRHTFAGVYPGLCYALPSGAVFARVCGALASPHRLMHGWQSVSENSGGALRPEAPSALLRAAATAPSTMLACPLQLPLLRAVVAPGRPAGAGLKRLVRARSWVSGSRRTSISTKGT